MARNRKCQAVLLGTFILIAYFGISLASCPNETRYMRSDYGTVNGLLAYYLRTNNTILPILSARYFCMATDRIHVGIRVWKRSGGGVESEITSGIPVAQNSTLVQIIGLKHLTGTWDCIRTTLALNDTIVVRVYFYREPTMLLAIWQLYIFSPPVGNATLQTERLQGIELSATTWTVHYYLSIGSGPYGSRTHKFGMGDSMYESKIENFEFLTEIVEEIFIGYLFIPFLFFIVMVAIVLHKGLDK